MSGEYPIQSMTFSPDEPLSFTPGYAALVDEELPQTEGAISFSPNSSYERYLKMHKVFVGRCGSEQLVDMHESLSNEFMPRYLSAAGWAAAEAAIVRTDDGERRRLNLIDKAVNCWRRAIDNQNALNVNEAEHLREYAFPHRTAVDIAISPLLRRMVKGDVDPCTPREVFEDCLMIAKKNINDLSRSADEGNIDALAEHIGLGYELNALLAFNRRFSQSWFVIPSMNRSDSGYYYPQQTHDLMVVHQKWGELLSAAPIEIKAAASARDRRRYKALLVRGKMHLSAEGLHRPEHTLSAIVAAHEGVASDRELDIADGITSKFIDMARDYYAGRKLVEMANPKGSMAFRDNSVVVQNHLGLVAQAAG